MQKYSNGRPDKLKETIERCRIPSKKRIKSQCMEFPEMFASISRLLDEGKVFQEFVSKRDQRIKKIIRSYLLYRQYSPDSKEAIRAFKELKEICRNFPWPKRDIDEACKFLRGMLPFAMEHGVPIFVQQPIPERVIQPRDLSQRLDFLESMLLAKMSYSESTSSTNQSNRFQSKFGDKLSFYQRFVLQGRKNSEN